MCKEEVCLQPHVCFCMFKQVFGPTSWCSVRKNDAHITRLKWHKSWQIRFYQDFVNTRIQSFQIRLKPPLHVVRVQIRVLYVAVQHTSKVRSDGTFSVHILLLLSVVCQNNSWDQQHSDCIQWRDGRNQGFIWYLGKLIVYFPKVCSSVYILYKSHHYSPLVSFCLWHEWIISKLILMRSCRAFWSTSTWKMDIGHEVTNMISQDKQSERKKTLELCNKACNGRSLRPFRLALPFEWYVWRSAKTHKIRVQISGPPRTSGLGFA